MLGITFPAMLIISLVCTLMPGTQMQGAFLFWFFIVTGILAVVYLIGLSFALRMIILPLQRFSEESFSNPDDFPEEYAKSLIYIPFLHLIMSWSTTFNGNVWALSFGLFMLSVLTVIILLGLSGFLLKLPLGRVPFINYIGQHSMVYFVVHYPILQFYRFTHIVFGHSIYGQGHWDDIIVLIFFVFAISTWLVPYVEKVPWLSGRWKKKELSTLNSQPST